MLDSKEDASLLLENIKSVNRVVPLEKKLWGITMKRTIILLGLFCLLGAQPLLAVEKCEKAVAIGDGSQECIIEKESSRQKPKPKTADVDAGRRVSATKVHEKVKATKQEDKKLLDELIK